MTSAHAGGATSRDYRVSFIRGGRQAVENLTIPPLPHIGIRGGVEIAK